jgi:hypothetical protein
LELNAATLAHLVDRFEREREIDVRVFLLEVIWQRRHPAAIAFLGQILRDANKQVWRTALDGLVALASPEALETLRNVRESAQDQEQTAWIDEAVEQVAAALAATPRTTS